MFQSLLSLFKKSGKILLAIFVPATASRRSESRAGRWTVAAIHGAAVVGIIAGLAVLQWFCELDRFVRSSSWVLRHGWLPVTSLMLYGLAWSCWYLAKVLRMPGEASAHGDIADAWRRAKDRIVRSGINPQTTPLFLVLGRPVGGIHHFFSAAGLSLCVPPTPADDDAPIRVCGNQDGLYICCDRVSLLDDFVSRLAVHQNRLQQSDRLAPGKLVSGNLTRFEDEGEAHHWEIAADKQPAKTVARAVRDGDSKMQMSDAVTAVVESQAGDNAALLDQSAVSTENRITSQIEHLQQQIHAADRIIQPTLPGDDLTSLESDMAEKIDSQLDYLCRLIIEERDPYCPINGVVLMVPIAATDSDELADHVGMRIEHDLQTVVKATETGMPVQMIITGLEKCVGSRELLNRFPKTQRDRRLGVVIPVAPASEPEAQASLIDSTCAWLCDNLFPPVIARLLDRDLTDPETDAVLRQGNQRLHGLVHTMRSRRFRLSRMMRRAIAPQGQNLSFRGCYFTATGEDVVHGQAFAAGVVPMILSCQNEVRWLESRRKRDQCQLATVVAGYLGLATAAIAMLVTFAL